MEFRPLVPATLSDFETLFGASGGCSGCWCMYWRKTRAEFGRDVGAGNRDAMRALVSSGVVPGLLAYRNGEPVGWCSVAPREDFASIDRSPVLKRLDDRPVWSVTCFFVRRDQRRTGVTRALLQAAIRHAAARGASLLEAYPLADDRKRADWERYMGLPKLYEDAGFEVVARPSASRLVMRKTLGPEDSGERNDTWTNG
jgi:GNAT superfamily N-acetyltransferase